MIPRRYSDRVAANRADLRQLKEDLYSMTTAWIEMYFVRFVYPGKAAVARHEKFVKDAERDLEMAELSILPGDSMFAAEAEKDNLVRKRIAYEDAKGMFSSIIAEKDKLLQQTGYHSHFLNSFSFLFASIFFFRNEDAVGNVALTAARFVERYKMTILQYIEWHGVVWQKVCEGVH